MFFVRETKKRARSQVNIGAEPPSTKPLSSASPPWLMTFVGFFVLCILSYLSPTDSLKSDPFISGFVYT